MRTIELNSLRLNAVRLNGIGECQRVSHAGAPPVVPDVPDVPEEPDVPSDPDVDENGYIIFADPEVARICVENWGDGVGITKAQVEAVTSIGTVFKDNTEITSFDEFEYFIGVTKIGIDNTTTAPFYNCINLERIKLPASLSIIAPYSFANTALLEVPNLENITDIGNNAFYKTTKMRGEVVTAATSIDAGAFASSGIDALFAPKVQSISFGSNNTNNGCFANCANLTKVVVGNDLTTIRPYAFYGCANLSDFTIPSSVTEIAAKVFRGCTSLEIEDLQLPNLETLGQDAFNGVKIKKISNLGKITELPTASAATQNLGDKSVLEEVVLPEGLIVLPNSSFSRYSKLSKVEWPTTLEKIGEYCFNECTSLPSTLELPYVTYIAMAAFNSVGIRRVILPNIETLEFGGNYAGVFVKNDVEFIHLGAKCSLIGSYTFSYATGQTPLTMICEAVTPPSLGDSIFHASGGKTFDFVYVPDASVEDYKTATNWSAYADRILPLSQYNG